MLRRRELAALLALAACGDSLGAIDGAPRRDGPPRAPDAATRADALAAGCEPVAGSDLLLEPVVDGLDHPVLVTAPPGDRRLFVVEQTGRIRIVDEGRLLPEPFLDLTDRVSTVPGEQGLLGLAFHPDWARSSRFYVYYTALGEESPYLDVLAEFTAPSAIADRADPGSERRLFAEPDPHKGHNGGAIGFGPDGYLYAAIGDGGGGGDPGDDAQDLTDVLGDMIRIDVDGGGEGDGEPPYRIPPGNPYAGGAGGTRPEIWLSGMRNPWRWSFDRASGELYIADVGEGTVEEVTLVPAGQSGLNLGWNRIEGDTCYSDPDCASGDYLAPLVTFRQGASGACAVIGGHVYRGACYPDLAGAYFYADYCTARVFTLRVEHGVLVDGPTDVSADLDPGNQLARISSFGEDARGEMYLVTRESGRLFHIAAQ
jgi:glucose/arabinose dehydrogenase